MKQLEQAQILLAKAVEDEHAVSILLEHGGVGDSIVGFHCQQAAEKLLKALLSAHCVVFRHRHNLTELLEALDQAGHGLPEELRGVDQFTPFAVEFRYDLFTEHTGFDSRSALAQVRRLREYVEKTVRTEADTSLI